MKKVALHNLGCKVNAYETEAMRQLLEQAGYEIVPFDVGADIFRRGLCLPSDNKMTVGQQDAIVKTVRECFE